MEAKPIKRRFLKSRYKTVEGEAVYIPNLKEKGLLFKPNHNILVSLKTLKKWVTQLERFSATKLPNLEDVYHLSIEEEDDG